MGPGILPETTVSKHNLPCHLQMPTQALSCKNTVQYVQYIQYVNIVQKRHRVLWAKAHLKWTVVWKSVLWWEKSKFDILVGNHGRRVLRAKEEGDLPACYQRSVQKPASLMVWGCISAYGMDSLNILEGTMNAERYIKVLEQHMLPSRQCVFQQDNAKPHTAAITTAWLRSRRVRVLNWPACSPDLSPIENIWHIITRKIRQRWPRTLQQLETYIRQEWDQIPTPKLQKLITSMPRRLQTVLKEEEMLHHGKHAPVPTILKPVAGIRFEMSSFCAYNCKISQFKHSLCYLCYIVNKILAHVILNSFSFHFIQIKKTSQHF